MENLFVLEKGRLLWRYGNETLLIQPWGENSLRVRSTFLPQMPPEDWALTEPVNAVAETAMEEDGSARITCGRITAKVSPKGKIAFYNQKGKLLLQEYRTEGRHALHKEPREFIPTPGGDWALTARFESEPREKLFGMGQYQQPYLDIKGCTMELAQRNSQASVPFCLSSLGYGILWNNPAVGEVTFGKNITEWKARSTRALDYWITAGDTPAQIEEAYAAVTGTVPIMPEYGLGFWQCKLRYLCQEELLEVAREYKRRNLPIDVIVIDFFHWPKQGDWKFDRCFWPDPEAMIAELRSLGIQLMVSIWPTVDKQSENFEEMQRKGYLVRCDRGMQVTQNFMAETLFYDATNPDARAFVWEKAKQNYYDAGVRVFWLDEAEPEYSVYDFDNYRYYSGTNLQTGNIYPVMYAKTFFDGMTEQGQEQVVNLIRCAWAGIQKYGALVWSGDIESSFRSMRDQLCIGLNMGIAGIPWWTTDIGGFYGGDIRDEHFKECLIRWFQWGAFCPVFRLHGDRDPHTGLPDTLPEGVMPGENILPSGAANEVWSYGEEAYAIFVKYMELREKLRPVVREAMWQAHKNGTPVMRTLFYEFPDDPQAWEIEDEYLFGDHLLVAPILEEGQRVRRIYLPAGATWQNLETGEQVEGGAWYDVDAPLDVIPVFIRDPQKFKL